MEQEIARAERQLLLLQAERTQVQNEIRSLRLQKQKLLRSIEENVAVLRRIRVLLQQSLDEL